MLLGAAKYLAETRNFAGTVQFVFQPAEEDIGGAERMLSDGLLERFPFDICFGMHNWPRVPGGRFSVREGPIMASCDTFSISVGGCGGHAALPHLCIDPIVAASQIVVALQTLVSRSTDPLDAAVLSVTQFNAGSASNIIPDEATIAGTVRAFKAETRDEMESKLRQVAAGVGTSLGARVAVKYDRGYPATVNSARESTMAAEAAAELVGRESVIRDYAPTMAAEDMSYLLNERPGCYAWLGTGVSSEEPMLHHPRYDFNDANAPLGASWLARVVERSMPL